MPGSTTRIVGAALAALMGLAGCNPAITGASGVPSPDFGGGFLADPSNSTGVVAVIEEDTATGATASYNAEAPPVSDYAVTYEPTANRIRIVSEGRAFADTFDTESRTFTNRGGTAFGSGVPNFARVATGEWTYAVDAMIDEGDGRYRHNLAVAGGEVFAPPRSGRGVYDSTMTGTIEAFDSTTWDSVPFVADGTVSVEFGGTRAVSKAFTLDPSRSNGATGAIAGSGRLTSDGRFAGTSSGSITVSGRTASPSGDFSGLVAGPNAQEAAGVVSIGTPSGASRSLLATGAFLGVDPGR